MKKIILLACVWSGALWCAFPVFAHAAAISDNGLGYSGYYFNDPTGYREVFTQQVVFHLHRNWQSCTTHPRPCADNEFAVTFTPTEDIPDAYGISIDDPAITDTELYNSQEGGLSFIFSDTDGAPLTPAGGGGAVQFRGSATTSAWATLNSQTSLQATTTYHLFAGVSYDIGGWWYDGAPANLTDGQTITIGIWEPHVVPIPSIVSSSLGQYESDATTPIVEGGLAASTTVVIKGAPGSAGTNELQLQIETKPANIPFDGTVTATSTFVSPGMDAAVTMSGLADGAYHWQGRAIDADGNASPWQTMSDPSSAIDFVIGKASATLYSFADRSSSIGTDNGQTGLSHATFGPLTVHIKLGQPLGGTASTTLSLSLYQESTSGCGTPQYTLQGYTDSDYAVSAGAAIVFENWIDASGTPVASADYVGAFTGTAIGRIDPFDYYTLSFGACDITRPGSIAAAPDATYTCTWQGGPFNNYCYAADVEGRPFMTLRAAGPREPVLIVPGITGSVLARAADGEEVWPNISKLASVTGLFSGDSYLDDLMLDAGGKPTVAMSTPDIIRTVTTTIAFIPISETFYGNLVDAFLEDGYVENKDLFVVPYDWRLDAGTATDALAAKVAAAVAVSPDGKINIIAHSMGGVLVKDYLSSRADTSFVDKLILVGVPQLGAPKAFKILNYGDNLGVALGSFDVLNAAEIKKIAQNMPSLYELLPSRRYVDIDGGYVRDFRNGGVATLGYDDTNDLMTSDPTDDRNTQLLNAADDLHKGFDLQTVNASSVYNIVGCQQPTISEFDLYDDDVVDVGHTSGDGTVPEVSAMNLADGFHNYFVLGDETGIDHMGLIKDARPVTLIKEIIEEDASSSVNVALPEGISTALSECFGGDAIEISVNGPADSDVYDAEGHHTGPLPDGSTELSIPGSQYDKIGDNAFITIPASSTYKVVSRAAAPSSTVTIKVKTTKKSKVVKKTTFVSVPLTSASATAELDLTGTDDDLTVDLDADGDGTTDATSSPDAILTTPSSTEDSTPPHIIMPVIPAVVAQGTTTTVTFGVTDEGSGLATTSATLDGDRVANGEVITFTKLGANVFAVHAIDNAGNPSAREIDFQVVATVPPLPSSTTSCLLLY